MTAWWGQPLRVLGIGPLATYGVNGLFQHRPAMQAELQGYAQPVGAAAAGGVHAEPGRPALPNGGLFAPVGELVVVDDGQRVVCHRCGRSFAFLPGHLPRHGDTEPAH